MTSKFKEGDIIVSGNGTCAKVLRTGLQMPHKDAAVLISYIKCNNIEYQDTHAVLRERDFVKEIPTVVDKRWLVRYLDSADAKTVYLLTWPFGHVTRSCELNSEKEVRTYIHDIYGAVTVLEVQLVEKKLPIPE